MTIEVLLQKILDVLICIDTSINKKIDTSVTPETFSLLTVKQFCKKHPWPNENGMRAIIFQADYYKAEKCFKRVGRRVLIDEKQFLQWISSNPKNEFNLDLALTEASRRREK